VEAAGTALPAEAQAQLALVHGERLVLEARLDALPRTAEAARARLDRWRARIDALDRQAFQLGYEVESSRAALAGTESWLEAHRAQLQAKRGQRDEFSAELRKHREVLADYEEQLHALRQQIAMTRDAAAGSEALDEEGRLRAKYVSLLAQERALLDGARGRLLGPAQARFDRANAASDRLGQLSARAKALSDWIAAEARRGADGLRARLVAEQAALEAETRALSAVQGESRTAVGQVVYHSFGEVRRTFYELVLQADVGLNDVVWKRKHDRVERIQQLSRQQADELKALDQRYGPVLKEEE
jgi:chromosome segregation ATPase